MRAVSGAALLSQNIEIERRFAAVLAADVAGFSRLTEADEVGTMRMLTARAGDPGQRDFPASWSDSQHCGCAGRVSWCAKVADTLRAAGVPE